MSVANVVRMPMLQNVNSVTLKQECGGGDCRAASSFPQQQWQPKVKKSSTTHFEVSFTLFYFLAALNFTFRNLIPFGFRSRKAGLLKLPKPCLFPCTFSLSSFVNNAKLKGYLYDNIVCDLKVILENFYQNFYFELNVKFSNFVQLTMTMYMIMDGLPKSKFEMRLSSLALLILEQFKARLLLISIERKIVHIQQAEFLLDERPTLAMLDLTIRIGCSTPTFLYFDLYLIEHCFRCTLRLFQYVNSRVVYVS